MTGITVREFNGKQIEQRTDGYIDATAMCKANGKKWNHYWSNKSTPEFLRELAAVTGIPATELVQVKQGGKPGDQGTYVHPRVATQSPSVAPCLPTIQLAGDVLEPLGD